MKIVPEGRKRKRDERIQRIKARVKFSHTQHSWERALERLNITPNQAIQDCIEHLNICRKGKKEKGKYLVVGSYAKYILGNHGDIITVLELDMCVPGFRKTTCKSPQFHGIPQRTIFKFPQ